MKQKLEKFEQNRILTTELRESMELDYKKGVKLEDIIKKSSHRIALDIQNPYSKSLILNKGIKKNFNTSNATTEPGGNNRYANNSSTLTSKQQSSIIRPNNSTSLNNNSKAYGERVPEAA